MLPVKTVPDRIPTSSGEGSLFSTFSLTPAISCRFDSSHPSRCEVTAPGETDCLAFPLRVVELTLSSTPVPCWRNLCLGPLHNLYFFI